MASGNVTPIEKRGYARPEALVSTEQFEAAQLVFAGAQRSRVRDTGTSARPWLYGIARHVVADEFRRRKALPLSAVPEGPVGRADQDDRLLLAAESLDAFWRGIARLSVRPMPISSAPSSSPGLSSPSLRRRRPGR